jgi:NADP-dependent aldehyde dehydrogenase
VRCCRCRFRYLSRHPREERAAFLERIADEILAIGEPLIAAAMRESGLPRARLEGERGRTMGQLRLFAVVRAGAWQQLRIDPALPDRRPCPAPTCACA